MLDRVPEPELMDDVAQARAYARADFADVNQGFVDRFRAAFPTLTRGRVLDLGCGPADIPIRLARALPALRITAVDAAAAMLSEAQAAVDEAGVGHRVALVRARLPALPFPPRGFDAVAANSLLHHLPDPAVFWSEAARVARPGAALLVVDLLRPDSIEQARSIVDRYAAGEDELLRRDFYHSLRAAFIPAEVERQLGTPLGSRLACSAVSDRHWAVTGHF